MRYLVRWWRPAVRVLALALVMAAVPLPSWAEEQTQAVATPGIRASIQKIAATEPTAPARGAAVSAQSGNAVDLGSSSFFKTKMGVAVIAVIAAGTGFAIYSAKNDRVRTPGR